MSDIPCILAQKLNLSDTWIDRALPLQFFFLPYNELLVKKPKSGTIRQDIQE